MTHFFRSPANQNRNETKIIQKYCATAFGVPILITIFDFIIDISPLFNTSLKCSMGTDRCWVRENRWIEFFYVYAPIFLILVLIITMYVITGRKIYLKQHLNCQYDSEQCQITQNMNECRVRFV